MDGGSVRGTWREGSFTEDPEGYVKKCSGNGVILHGGPFRGPWKGRNFTVDFERKVRFCFIRRPLLLGREICKKKEGAGKGQLSP
jgi:hypothetical protein